MDPVEFDQVVASGGSQYDSRGVERGSCSMCGCDQYDGGSEGKKCEACSHVPGKHANFSKPASPRPISNVYTIENSRSATELQSDNDGAPSGYPIAVCSDTLDIGNLAQNSIGLQNFPASGHGQVAFASHSLKVRCTCRYTTALVHVCDLISR